MEHSFLNKLTGNESYAFKYSVCTLTNRVDEYHQMVSSFLAAGFDTAQCEFLYIDNTGQNNFDAYQGIHLLLKRATGKYIIVCHQDVLVDQDRREVLDIRLEELELKDKNWAICGNAGGAGPNNIVYHISYPNGVFKNKGTFPMKVASLDENFLVLKKSAMLAPSNDLSGFHLYATDLCLNAELRGFTAYVIAFNLTHKSHGNPDITYLQSKKQFIKKYNRFFRSRWIQTPITAFFLSGSLLDKILGTKVVLFFIRMWNGLQKRQKLWGIQQKN